jgi:hypothetical protein
MMSGKQKVLAVLAVTTALCADQSAMAAPVCRTEPAEIGCIAQRLVNRLARNLCRVLPSALRWDGGASSASAQRPPLLKVAAAATLPHRPVSPFQFRLPPPLV